ncbi:MAG: tetratricopeptide repeat protein, partial [Nitrospina sp.]|nr:tetratricopeptide repeat protein [Nitrospina sp.]
LAGQGKLKEAIEYFENAININPNYVDASNNLEIARSLLK